MTTTVHVAPEEVMAWLDGELPTAERHAVAAHLEECSACALVASQLRHVSEDLAGWSVPAVPDRLERSVIDAIRTARHATSRESWHWGRWGVGLGAVAALVLVVGSTSLHYRQARLMMEDKRETSDYLRPEIARPLSATDGMLQSLPDASETTQRTRNSGVGSAVAKAGKNAGGDGAPAPATVTELSARPMIARTVSLAMRVKQVEATRTELDATLARHHGYVAQLSVGGAEGSGRTLRASLRIPAGELAAALNEIRAFGRVESEMQSGEEVTAQHEDLVARLKNAGETEVRLQAILQQRTGRISDVLEVEQEIARVRGEIETMEAEQAGLEHRVQFASVDVLLTEEYKAEFRAPDSVGTRLRNGLVTGYENARDSALGLALFVEEYGPAIVVWMVVLGGPVIWMWRRYRRVHRSL